MGTYTERTGSANPFDGIDVGLSAAPVFVPAFTSSIHGNLDLVLGNNDGTLRYYVFSILPTLSTVNLNVAINTERK